MYIWRIALEEHWSDDEPGEYNDMLGILRFAAPTFESAVEKAKKYAMKGRSFVDDEGKKQNIVDVRVVSVERDGSLDG